MSKPFLVTVLFCLFPICGVAKAQNLCPAGRASDKLICLIPQVYGPNGLEVKNPAQQGNFGVNFLTSSLSALESAVAKQSSLLPLASPSSGITYSWDPVSKVFLSSTDSFGPILGERADTIGKYRVSLGFDYQYFGFNSLDGLDLKKLPVVLPQDDFPLNDGSGTICSINGTAPAQMTGDCGFIRDVVTTQNRLDLKIHQYTTFVTFGLTNRIDVSVAIPIENVRMGMTSTVTVSHNDSPTRFAHAFAANPPVCPAICLVNTFSSFGSASGIGDVTLRVKGTAWKGERAGLALGVDVRAPTGDSLNYLGAGAAGVKPFVIWSYRSRISPHAFVGYETNGSSAIAGDISSGKKERLPGDLTYSAGADVWLTKWLTAATDVVGQQVFQARRTTTSTFTEPGACNSLACDNPATPKIDPNLSQLTGTFNITNISFGAKLKPFSTLLVTANVLVKLNDGGLRSKFVPLVGISYTF
jgi:hypothetical protein